MNRLLRTLPARLRGPQAAAVIGGVVAAAAIAFHLGITVPTQAAIDAAKRDLAALHDAAERGRHSAGDAAPRPQGQQLQEFYRSFPELESAPDWLEKIHAAAARQGLRLSEGEYRLAPDRNDRLIAYQIVLPVRGRYAQVRKFAVQVLQEVPSAALQELSFRREAIASTEVEARIRITLYLRAGP